jgi:S1-C subfamily serine protease
VASDETHPRSWILTAGHFVEPLVSQSITVRSAGRARRDRARVVASSRDPDLALLLLEGRVLPAVKLRRGAALGDGVWVVAYPWGRSLTVASGIVSQVDPPGDDAPLAGNPRLVDVSVSYGASGGGVFDAATGELLGLVEGHRTARITLPRDPTASVQVPVAGETIVIPVSVMARFLTEAGLATVVPAGAPGSDAPASR